MNDPAFKQINTHLNTDLDFEKIPPNNKKQSIYTTQHFFTALTWT